MIILIAVTVIMGDIRPYANDCYAAAIVAIVYSNIPSLVAVLLQPPCTRFAIIIDSGRGLPQHNRAIPLELSWIGIRESGLTYFGD